ncbi:hypothetical protein Tco_0676894 [Tanacetum coccineum]
MVTKDSVRSGLGRVDQRGDVLMLHDEFESRGGRIARWKVFRGVWVSRLENGQQGGDVAFLVTKGGKIFMLAGRELSQEINNHSVPTLISQAHGPSRKRSRTLSMPSYPDATTFSDGKPASETPELNPEDVMARLKDMEVEIDTVHVDAEDKELLISELQDSLATAENEISILQMRADDAENRHAEDHEQIQKILAHLGL